MVLAATTNTFVGVQNDPAAFKRIFGRNYQRQYPIKLPERILPDECVPFDEEWR
jgi:hypothetical protein